MCFYETNLKSVVLPTGLKYISNEAFKFCYNLKTVTLPNTVESLGNACFGSCTSLQSISIPNSVKDMRWSTFDRCTSLKTVTIGCGVDTMETYSVLGVVRVSKTLQSIPQITTTVVLMASCMIK